ncbi:DUF1254 domain-containing protein [Nocardia carnea]|uniref:DUF1254 domain-containing protein n=1 Tax=Nocardia carnea TaxID=37328 RepID=UPI00245428CE|nr:DUF1254 domain-containing protein [Nocardia carnea]
MPSGRDENDPSPSAISGVRTYEPGSADQLTASPRPDITPSGPGAREALARMLALQAVVYGLPSVYQYASMCAQCAPSGDGDLWSLNEFSHSREPAGPDYQAFRVPNVDTLYSNAWLDLTDGPALLDLPDFRNRYYTLNFLDAYSNASNISARTHPGRSRFLIATTDWTGPVPSGYTLFRVATPLMWILLRIQLFGPDDLTNVHRLQNAVHIHHNADRRRSWPVLDQARVETSPEAFFGALDISLRINGTPTRDAAHIRQFRTLGICAADRDPGNLDESSRQGMRAGFHDALALLAESRPLLGEPVGTGWTQVLDKGAHGDNFLARAVMNFVGLAANVVEENCSYNTYVDATGEPLTGAGERAYRIDLPGPPPAEAFWSITLYEAETGRLYNAPEGRYAVGSGTGPERLSPAEGPAQITVSTAPPTDSSTWLPCPPYPFFLVLRMYQPMAVATTGGWRPPPVHRMDPGV